MAVKRQLSMVLDLNKCIGCHTCTAACKLMWTNRNGREFMYWNNVETQPGLGYPRDYQEMGGGFDADGALRLGAHPSTCADALPALAEEQLRVALSLEALTAVDRAEQERARTLLAQ